MGDTVQQIDVDILCIDDCRFRGRSGNVSTGQGSGMIPAQKFILMQSICAHIHFDHTNWNFRMRRQMVSMRNPLMPET